MKIFTFGVSFLTCNFIYLDIYLDKNITLIQTVDIEDNKYYLNNIMEKVIPKSKTKFLQNFFWTFRLEEAFVSSSI